MEHKLVDGIQIPLSAQEIAQRQADEVAWNAGAFDRAMVALRSKRNSLLAQTDFYALSDNILTPAMTTYRQSLRDLTEGLDTVSKVNSVKFPAKP